MGIRALKIDNIADTAMNACGIGGRYYAVIYPSPKGRNRKPIRERYCAYDESDAFNQFSRFHELTHINELCCNNQIEIKPITRQEWNDTRHLYDNKF